MARRGEKSLEVRAKQHISICCKTLCEREVVEEYIKYLEDKVEELTFNKEVDIKYLEDKVEELPNINTKAEAEFNRSEWSSEYGFYIGKIR
jgi:hypothetical protein|tara:strand:+ start:414 stop:686 length:273 start_codon:yes stop_codon:yes gene_type:complete